jgi:hypothetical protein
MTVDAEDLIASLKLQREVQANEAAMMDAAYKGALRQLAAEKERADRAEARIKELQTEAEASDA